MAGAESTYANPGAIHADGVAAKRSLEASREGVARALGCKAQHVVFTSGLTEANNLAVLGRARGISLSGTALSSTHWIVSSIEHDSVLAAFGEVERLGGRVTFVDPDERGLVVPERIARALRRETVLVSVGWANNEIGVVQPLSRIARAVREFEKAEGARILFHSDAGQAPLYLPTVVSSLGVDLLALGAGKLYGPRSCGALFVAERSLVAPLILGGKQEGGLRAGTEEVVSAAGFAGALGAVVRERERESRRLRALRDTLAAELQEKIPGLVVNGDLSRALPHMLNISVPGVSSEYLVLSLDREGFSVSTKSACREGEEGRSHVVAALGGEEWRARNTIRISLGRETRERELERFGRTLARVAPLSRE